MPPLKMISSKFTGDGLHKNHWYVNKVASNLDGYWCKLTLFLRWLKYKLCKH
jgi:hypothetical protein